MNDLNIDPNELDDPRNGLIKRIHERVMVVDNGFVTDGRPSPCHIWQGPTSGEGRGGGYGRMSLNGQTVAVHLVVYSHFYGYIPGKKQIDHLCNNRLCCNPLHLEMVTHKTNQRRRAARSKDYSNLTVTYKDEV